MRCSLRRVGEPVHVYISDTSRDVYTFELRNMAEEYLNISSRKLKYLKILCRRAEGKENRYATETMCVSGRVKFFVTCVINEIQERKLLEVESVSVVLEKELDLVEMSLWLRLWEKTKDTEAIYHALTEYGQLATARDDVFSMLQMTHCAYFWFRRSKHSGHYTIFTLDRATGNELMRAEWAIKWDNPTHCMVDNFTFAFSKHDEWLYLKLEEYIDVLCAAKSLSADELKFYWHKLALCLKSAISYRETSVNNGEES